VRRLGIVILQGYLTTAALLSLFSWRSRSTLFPVFPTNLAILALASRRLIYRAQRSRKANILLEFALRDPEFLLPGPRLLVRLHALLSASHRTLVTEVYILALFTTARTLKAAGMRAFF